MLGGVNLGGKLRNEKIAGLGGAEGGDATRGEVENARKSCVERGGERLLGMIDHERFHRKPDHQRQVVIGGVLVAREQAADESGAELLARGPLRGGGDKQADQRRGIGLGQLVEVRISTQAGVIGLLNQAT